MSPNGTSMSSQVLYPLLPMHAVSAQMARVGWNGTVMPRAAACAHVCGQLGLACMRAGGLTVDLASHPLHLPSGVQSPTGKPPPSPGGHAPPARSASERSLSAASTPGKGPGAPPAPLGGAGGSGNVAAAVAAAAAAGKGVPIKGDRGRFKVYEVRRSVDCRIDCLCLCCAWLLMSCSRAMLLLAMPEGCADWQQSGSDIAGGQCLAARRSAACRDNSEVLLHLPLLCLPAVLAPFCMQSNVMHGEVRKRLRLLCCATFRGRCRRRCRRSLRTAARSWRRTCAHLPAPRLARAARAAAPAAWTAPMQGPHTARRLHGRPPSPATSPRGRATRRGASRRAALPQPVHACCPPRLVHGRAEG